MPPSTNEQTDFVVSVALSILSVAGTLYLRSVANDPKNKPPTVTDVLLYPIKSCGQISVQEATAQVYGFEKDRIFQVTSAGTSTSDTSTTTSEKRFCTPREKQYEKLCFVQPKLVDKDTMVLTSPDVDTPLQVKLSSSSSDNKNNSNRKTYNVNLIVGPGAKLEDVGSEASAWLEQATGCPKGSLLLTAIGKDFARTVQVNPKQGDALPPFPDGAQGHVVALGDEAPYHLCSKASLNELNRRLKARGKSPMDMRRFRPNLVVEGFPAWAEDTWARIRIGAVEFYVWQRCGRCLLTTIDRDTLERGPEPLATLTTFRERDHGMRNFGMYLIPVASTCPNVIRPGDSIEVLEFNAERKEEWERLYR